ncbi:MAG: 3'-5' exonuclease [Kiritimatiellae bacterium]|nr:3'-5' exonuclease [Kiritimatiellia bacterium]
MIPFRFFPLFVLSLCAGLLLPPAASARTARAAGKAAEPPAEAAPEKAAASGAMEVPAFRLPAGNARFENIPFVVYDTETTGFSPVNDRILEIGAIKIVGGVEIDRATWLINPERYIPYFVQEVHHITYDMVKDCPTFAQVYPEFAAFVGSSVLIAHNARFDNRFMSAEIARAGLPVMRNAVIDSLTLFRRWHPELESHTVSALIDYYGLDSSQGNLHRATDDSFFVYKAIAAELARQSDEPRFRDLTRIAPPMYFADAQ